VSPPQRTVLLLPQGAGGLAETKVLSLVGVLGAVVRWDLADERRLLPLLLLLMLAAVDVLMLLRARALPRLRRLAVALVVVVVVVVVVLLPLLLALLRCGAAEEEGWERAAGALLVLRRLPLDVSERIELDELPIVAVGDGGVSGKGDGKDDGGGDGDGGGGYGGGYDGGYGGGYSGDYDGDGVCGCGVVFFAVRWNMFICEKVFASGAVLSLGTSSLREGVSGFCVPAR
jgi:hypothetical protein